MADWYVYQHDGDPLGPWSTDAVAEAILAGKLAPDVWVAAPGGPRWLRALDVPIIGRLVEGIPTRPRRDSGLRLMPSAATIEAAARAHAEATMMIVDDAEVSLSDSEAAATSGAATKLMAPITRRAGVAAADDTARFPIRDFTIEEPEPPTDRVLPPPSSPSAPLVVPAEALEAPSTDRRRRRRNA